MPFKGLSQEDTDILVAYAAEEDWKLTNTKEARSYIHEAGECEEEFDSDYLTTSFYLQIDNKIFSVYYSQYRKDGTLCSEEWSEDISCKIESVINWDTIEQEINCFPEISGCGCGELDKALSFLRKNYNVPTKK